MGILKRIFTRVVTDGFDHDDKSDAPPTTSEAGGASLDECLYEYTGSTQINLKTLFKGQEFSRYRDNPYREIEDKNDKNYWWSYEGSPDYDSIRQEIPYSPEKLTEVIRHLNLKIEAGNIPVFSVPQHLYKVMGLLSRDDFDYGEIAMLIEQSPALAGMFINSINSAIYNRGFAISELRPALSRLGKNNIRALLQLYSIKVGFAGDERFGAIAAGIIHHSYAVAVIASYLSQRFFPDPSLAFLAGLLHDIGKLGILKELSLNRDFCDNLKGKPNEYMFEKIFVNRHEKVGHFLGEKWHMDPLSLAAIAAHHNFWEHCFAEEDQLDFHLCLIINLSDTIARILGKGKPIAKTNIFREPATIDLCIEKDFSTIEFLNDLPEVVRLKTANQIF